MMSKVSRLSDVIRGEESPPIQILVEKERYDRDRQPFEWHDHIKDLIDKWSPPRNLDEETIEAEAKAFWLSPTYKTSTFIHWLIHRGYSKLSGEDW